MVGGHRARGEPDDFHRLEGCAAVQVDKKVLERLQHGLTNDNAMIAFMVPGLSTPVDIETKLRASAHHEAGHLVVAAVMDLALRPEGLMIDPVAEGLACYCKKPEDEDSARERVLTATFAGRYAQKRFCEESSVTFAQDLSMTCDWWEAHRILCAM